MMAKVTPNQLLKQCEARGIVLFVDLHGELSYRAKPGLLTDPVRNAIKAYKAQLLEICKRQDPNWDLSWLEPLAREVEAEQEALYVSVIREAYRASLSGELPELIPLYQGTNAMRGYITKNLPHLRLLRDIHGDKWRDIDDAHQRAANIETIAWWWHKNKATVLAERREAGKAAMEC